MPDNIQVLEGDCLDILVEFDDESVDLIYLDPLEKNLPKLVSHPFLKFDMPL